MVWKFGYCIGTSYEFEPEYIIVHSKHNEFPEGEVLGVDRLINKIKSYAPHLAHNGFTINILPINNDPESIIEGVNNNKELTLRWVKRTEEEYRKSNDKPKLLHKLVVVKSDIPKYVEGEDFHLTTEIFNRLDRILSEEGYTFTILPDEKDPEVTI